MKTIITSTMLMALCVMLMSCGSKNSDATQQENKDITQLPQQYRDYLNNETEDQWFPVIDGDDGMSAITDKVEFLVLPQELASNKMINSMANYYNLFLGYWTILYDIDTYSRFVPDAEDAQQGGKAYATALSHLNVASITDSQLRDELTALASKISAVIAQGKDLQYCAVDETTALNNHAKSLSADFQVGEEFNAYTPGDVLDGYDSIHSKALADSLYYGQLLKMVVAEKNFEKQTILAKELALCNHTHLLDKEEEVIAVTHHLLTAGTYSPMLYDLWRVWRSTLQVSYLSGMSRDSAIYNVLYNKMKTRVALTWLKYIASHPNDKVAIDYFTAFTEESCIVRANEFPYGNSAAMDLFYLYGGNDDDNAAK